jgi:isoamylase
MIALRMKHFALSREEFVNRTGWHGLKPGNPDWTGQSRTLAFQMHGWHDQAEIFVMFSANWDPQQFALPDRGWQRRWRRLVDTSLTSPDDIVDENDAVALNPADHYIVNPRTTVILMSPA